MIGEHEVRKGLSSAWLSSASYRAIGSVALGLLGAFGCATGTTPGGGGGGSGTTTSSTTTDTTSTTTSTDTTSTTTSLCKQDCSQIKTPMCLMAVCNDGGYPGTVGECTVVNAPAGATCDDSQFCTVGDQCDGDGKCVGGKQNDCGMNPPACTAVICDELAKSCGTEPAADGDSCNPTDVCQVNGACKNGLCVGEAKDCTFSPLSECNAMHCNPTTGACEGTPDATKNGDGCSLTGDPCKVGRTCNAGQCTGGTPKDCSALTQGCNNGVCNAQNGSCEAQPVAPGGACFAGIDQCHVGTCDAAGACNAAPVANGTACNDHNPCTGNDVCTAGTCGGSAVAGCVLYNASNFESCPDGWTLHGDWQCGAPSAGPSGAHGGSNVIATKLAGDYTSSQTYAACTADSPTIDLTTAVAPVAQFWAWVHTEGSTYDGFNLKISTNGGSTFTTVTNVSPTYSLTVGGEPAWGDDMSAAGWQPFSADLTAYKGHQAILRFAFQSDSIVQYEGVYIDDLIVAEPSAIPLAITTSTVPDAYSATPYTAQLARSGGSTGAQWSITGGTNHGWLTIDPTTGALSGTPALANVGPVTVNVKVQEPTLASNTATATISFNVYKVAYAQDFEGNCNNNGWTLAGDWQCGTPSVVGPANAYSGTKCIATKISGDYSDNQAYSACTATSPDINLAGTTHPKLSFRMWVETEGSPYDAFHLEISTNGGASYTLVSNVTPAYNATAGGQAGWGDDLSLLGWQLAQADLAAYVGQTIRVRFAFQSDSSSTYSGAYIDDVLVLDN